MAQMNDDALKALTDAEMRQAVGYYGGKLSEQRRKAEYYYLGLAKGDLSPPEVAGRSQVVSPVVRNTIEAMLPQLMVKFTGGETVVEFEPTKPGDEAKAKQCTDYLNYLFFKKSNGHQLTLTWFKDALLQKRGIMKVWWDTRTEETREEYRGLDQIELAQIADDDELEITEQKSYPDEEAQEARQKQLGQMQQALDAALTQAQQGNQQAALAFSQIKAQMDALSQQPVPMLFDVVCKRSKKGGKVCIENVPPEEFLISRRAKMDIQTAPFVGHRVRRTASELMSMGYPKSVVERLASDDSMTVNAEQVERLSWDDEFAYLNTDGPSSDPSQRNIWVTECYVRVDYDGDGIAELRKIVRAGNEILDNEVVDVVPFVSICPVPLPHKFFGLSIADLGFEGQKTETALLRAQLDNLYLEVNGRYFAVENQVNLDDLLTSRPGGVVRVKSANAVGRLDQGKGSFAEAMGMLEYMRQFNEDSTGWSRQSQGNDPNGIAPETATKANIVANKADMRTDLIARNFAEGFVDLFRMMLKLVCQYQDSEAEVKIAGQWVQMDPREWRNQFDVTINVGLGVGSKDQQVAHLMTLYQALGHAMPLGVVKPENVYNVLTELAKNMGFKSADKFVSKPDPNWHPPDPNQGQMMIEQAKLQTHGQIEQMKLQAQMQAEAAAREHEAQLEQMKAQMQAEVDNNRQASEAQQKTLEMQQQAQLEALKTQHENEKHQREQEVQMAIAKLQAETSVIVAQIGAASKAQSDAHKAQSDAAKAEGESAKASAPQPDNSGVLAVAIDGFRAAIEGLNRPKTIQRGPDGRATGIA